jgi:hypothetical protein
MSTEEFMVAEHNVSSGEVVTRSMTDQEKADYLMQIDKIESNRIEAEQIEQQRLAILDRIGLSKEDLNIILGIPNIPEVPDTEPEPMWYEDTIIENKTILPTGPAA